MGQKRIVQQRRPVSHPPLWAADGTGWIHKVCCVLHTRGSGTCRWVGLVGCPLPAPCYWMPGSSCLQPLCPAQHSFLAQHPSAQSTLGPPSYEHHMGSVLGFGWVLHPLQEQRRAESIRFHKGYSYLSQNALLSCSSVFSEINMFYLFI